MIPEKKILIVSESQIIRTFIQPTVNSIRNEKNVQFDCFIINKTDPEAATGFLTDFTHVFIHPYPRGFWTKIPKLRFFNFINGIRKNIGNLGRYDVIHIFFHHYYYSLFTEKFKKKTDKLYLTFIGSDFNDLGRFKHFGNSISVSRCDGVFSLTEDFLNRVIERYKIHPEKTQTGILFFNLPLYKKFADTTFSMTRKQAKQQLGIRKKIIVCGYNGDKIHQQTLIIPLLMNIKEKLSEYKIIFPMTYGNNAVQNRGIVRDLLAGSGLDFMILEDFLPVDKVLEIRFATDIFIHLATRDALSDTLLEHLYAGSFVITGNWLPYQSLIDKGVLFDSIASIQELPDRLAEVLDKFEEHMTAVAGNKPIISKLFDWENAKQKWFEIYNLR